VRDETEQEERLVALSSRLREIRARRRLSQEDVAVLASMSRGFYGGIERASENPSIKALWAIADALDVHVTELLRDGRGHPSDN
jgi:transcriptional regulator with XRE-family HTH domain